MVVLNCIGVCIMNNKWKIVLCVKLYKYIILYINIKVRGFVIL